MSSRVASFRIWKAPDVSGPVIITRAEPGASETEDRLRQLGYDTLRLPALTLRPRTGTESPPERGSFYIFTSANGVRAALERDWPMATGAICVGPSTRDAAIAAGCGPVLHADGNANDVHDLICREFRPQSAPLFYHVANNEAAGDLVRRLKAAGFRAEFRALYEAVATGWDDVSTSWPDTGSRAVLLVHSAKAAEAVSRWLSEGRADRGELILVGISERAIAPLEPARFQQTAIAARPNETELIKALQTVTEPGVSSS